ncbi:MAG: molybdopterin-binding protein [Gammaproteobacteria bacterium]
MCADITAGVIIIGNEILSGRTQDSNLSFIGRRLDELGIHLVEASVIPDKEQVIIDTVNEYRNAYDYVFTTGGIGPTHDDITALSIARAFDIELERNPEAVTRLENYYEPGNVTGARLKMADVPVGAHLIDNPISGAPGFQIENVFVMAGVPAIMQLMFDGITDRMTGGDPILTASVATNIGEGTLADGLNELQDRYSDISIGSYPYFRNRRLGVNIVMRSTDVALLAELSAQVKSLIQQLGGKIVEEHAP